MSSEFRTGYAAALTAYLEDNTERRLAVAHDLGRQALLGRISVLQMVEDHIRLVDEIARDRPVNTDTALQFLLQALAAVDVAVRGYLEGTRRYEKQRARADGLAGRDTFRSALVNAMQEAFFVMDRTGSIIDINEAFTEVTGYDGDDLPFRWPHPWLTDQTRADEDLIELMQHGRLQLERQIRHRSGHLAWVAVSMNVVNPEATAFVGTMRDITTARKAAARESALTRLATAAGVATSVPEVLSIMLDECRPAIDSRRVVAVTWPEDDGEATVQVVGDSEHTAWADLDESLRATLLAARGWPPLTVQPVSDAGQSTSRGIVAVLSGTPTTVLWLEHRMPRPVGIDGRRLINALVGHVSLAVQHVRHFELARESSLTLQRAMLPDIEPLPGFAVRYEPAVPPLEIGGDWYDVLPLDDHQIGIIVGDCVGRGLSAAAVMGQLRSSARALLLSGAEPARLLEHLDAVAALIPDAYCATVLLGVLDIESGVLRYSNAGHVPALLAGPEPHAIALTDGASVPLGVQQNRPRPQVSRRLPPGATLMLYTDGLVERRDAPIDTGMDRACQLLTQTLQAAPETVADAMLGEMAPPAGYDDDVAIVVYRHSFAPLRIEVPATPDRLSEVRARLTGWLDAAGVPELLSSDIVLAVNEACTNSVEHAYRDTEPGRMQVHADLRGERIDLRIVDYGTWKMPDANPRIRGRGLPMMRAISADVQVDPTRTGTTVELTFMLSGEPALT
ncbi:SpoIIE family protein phosphatase [Mycolicibacterium thermoresistibile]